MDSAVQILVIKDQHGFLTEGSVQALTSKRGQLRKIIFKWEREARFDITPPVDEFDKIRRQMVDVDFLLVDAEQTEDTEECQRWDNKLEFIYSIINRKLTGSSQQNGNHSANTFVANNSSLPTPAPGPPQTGLGSHPGSSFSHVPHNQAMPAYEISECQFMEPDNKLGAFHSESTSFANAYVPDDEDDVTPCRDMPNFLQFDRLSGKYIFHLGLFDFDTVIAKKRLQVETVVQALTWAEFNKTTSEIIASYYTILANFYKNGISSKFRRHFCAALSSKLPLMEKKYLDLREQTAQGSLYLSDTVKSIVFYAVSHW